MCLCVSRSSAQAIFCLLSCSQISAILVKVFLFIEVSNKLQLQIYLYRTSRTSPTIRPVNVVETAHLELCEHLPAAYILHFTSTELQTVLQTYMCWAIDKAAQVIDRILWWSRVHGLRARCQMFFNTTASQKWGAGQGRTTQRDELFMVSLHDTPASRGRDGWCSGWRDEQMKSKWRRVEGLKGSLKKRKEDEQSTCHNEQ